MKTIDSIPTSKIQRATKLVQTGAKVGVNYLKYYGNRMTTSEEEAKEKLDQDNAEDIYGSLRELKGSALKVAQMLSMEKSMLPRAYVEKFSLSQFSVPPLSAPLVNKTFKKYFGSAPSEVYDSFNPEAVHGASIGQVHQAEKDGKKLAVKIQYPGVSDSIATDLALVKPIALKMFNIKGKDSDKYFKEVRDKLMEETNYLLEVEQSQSIVDACSHLPNLKFPSYYVNLSSEKIITMDWMEGEHLSEFTAHNTDNAVSNVLGQALWDFYMYQIHRLKKVHADPHPGNFLVSKDNQLVVLDFGCIKAIPDSFYVPYFELAKKENISNPEFFQRKLFELEILRPEDSPEEIKFFTAMFQEMLSLFTQPFHNEVFDFSDKVFFGKITELGKKYAQNTELRRMDGNRGSKHFIYINRTFFGLYNLMHDLKANMVKVNNFNMLA
ncbi:Predicted unusual protein kinase regulating ubiquinone biosynthesis, AarF/ABC1/UbiB family [Flagellimonas taeanensis]|uniref:Predicted unusual protein kinase regulating ubiquinone biosynthesis, AarF/ABC1/UbiB family n=1 Tax=Flagellimonas taeanensis TaxID=1005926 RepID=A0A1M6Z6H4_9FLAO|nr:AarF/UbiB family protein [Allomuricauda taeanensis]SFC11369.1 Predicted unusual protein kinase regulating ubiquinone biosynthesis, AarF/ABC1/UbiB family [Allomuricauda taeanensis]SHL26030.1 Predicted unusual protein kinase regulating ubiquinone biosynthesis, AarF/ABC1/UbiB family [Allomuricauda taeanensis]